MQKKEGLEEARESCIPQHASLMLAVGLVQSLSNAAACLAVMLCLRIEADLWHCLLGVGRREPEVVMLALAGHTKTNWMIAPQLHHSTVCLTPCLWTAPRDFPLHWLQFLVCILESFTLCVSMFYHIWKSLPLIKVFREAKLSNIKLKQPSLQGKQIVWCLLSDLITFHVFVNFDKSQWRLFFPIYIMGLEVIYFAKLFWDWPCMQFYAYHAFWCYYSAGKNKDPYSACHLSS